MHEIETLLCPEKSKALPVFHTFIGCHQTSFFAGRGTNSARETWRMHDEVTTVFAELREAPGAQVLVDKSHVLER